MALPHRNLVTPLGTGTERVLEYIQREHHEGRDVAWPHLCGMMRRLYGYSPGVVVLARKQLVDMGIVDGRDPETLRLLCTVGLARRQSWPGRTS